MANQNNTNFELFKLKTGPKPQKPTTPLFVDNRKQIVNIFGGGCGATANPYGLNNSILCPSSIQSTNWLNRGMPSIWDATIGSSCCSTSSSCSNSNNGLDTKDIIVAGLLSNPQALQVAGNLLSGLFGGIANMFGFGGDDKQNAQNGVQVGNQTLEAGTQGIFHTQDGKFVQGTLNSDGTVKAADGKNYQVSGYAGQSVGGGGGVQVGGGAQGAGSAGGGGDTPAPASTPKTEGTSTADTKTKKTDDKPKTEDAQKTTTENDGKNQVEADNDAIASADDALAAYNAANDEMGTKSADSNYEDDASVRTKALGDLTKARETLNTEKTNNEKAIEVIGQKIEDLKIKIAEKEKAVTEAENKANLNNDETYKGLKDKTKGAKIAYDNGKKAVTKAEEQQKTNAQNYEKAKGETTKAAAAKAQKESAMNEANAAVGTAKTNLANAMALPADDPSRDTAIANAEKALRKAEAQAQKAETEFEQAKKQHEAAQQREKDALKAKTDSDNALNKAKAELEQQKIAWDKAKKAEEEYVQEHKEGSAEAIKKAKAALDAALEEKAKLEGEKEALQDSKTKIDTKLKEVDEALGNQVD